MFQLQKSILQIFFFPNFLLFGPCHRACRTLVPQPGIQPTLYRFKGISGAQSLRVEPGPQEVLGWEQVVPTPHEPVCCLPLRRGADQTEQGGAQGGEGGEAGERPDQAAPASPGSGHLGGGLPELHVLPGGGGAPGQEEAGAHYPRSAAPVSPLTRAGAANWGLAVACVCQTKADKQRSVWARFSDSRVNAVTTRPYLLFSCI